MVKEEKFQTARRFLQEARTEEFGNDEAVLELLEKFLTQPETLPEDWDSRLLNFREEDQKIGELTEEEKRFLFNGSDLVKTHSLFFILLEIHWSHIKTRLGRAKNEKLDICKGGIIVKGLKRWNGLIWLRCFLVSSKYTYFFKSLCLDF